MTTRTYTAVERDSMSPLGRRAHWRATAHPLAGAPIATTHRTDADCAATLDGGDYGTCTVCGVYHDEPCDDCGGRGFHRDGCPEWTREATDVDRYGTVRHCCGASFAVRIGSDAPEGGPFFDGIEDESGDVTEDGEHITCRCGARLDPETVVDAVLAAVAEDDSMVGD